MGFDVHLAIKDVHFAEKVGTDVYRKLLPELKEKHLAGQYIAIRVPTGEWLIAKTELELMDLCDKQLWGDAPAWVQKIEYDESDEDDWSRRPPS